MKEIKLEELNLNPFTAFGKDWMALSAGNEQDGCNSMTVSWGHVGIVWDDEKGYLPTAIVYVRPQRYTKKFMDCEEYFTLSYLAFSEANPDGTVTNTRKQECILSLPTERSISRKPRSFSSVERSIRLP